MTEWTTSKKGRPWTQHHGVTITIFDYKSGGYGYGVYGPQKRRDYSKHQYLSELDAKRASLARAEQLADVWGVVS